MGFFAAACGFVIFLYVLYRYLTATYNFWKERGVPGPEPELIFGTMKNFLLKREWVGFQWKRMYDTYEDSQFVGLFKMREPVLLIKDPKHIKDVFTKDSSIFCTRGMRHFPNAEPWQQFLFYQDGAVAASLRAKVSPIFTPSKLKEIFSVTQECVVRLENYMDALLSESDCVNCSEVCEKLTADIIGSSLMSINMKTLSLETNEENEFIKYTHLMHGKKANQFIKTIFSAIFPHLYDLIGYHLFHHEKLLNFYTNFISTMMEYRKKHNIVKCDFIDFLMKLKNNPGKLREIIDITNHYYGIQMSGFFYASFDTSSTTTANTLYELAKNQHIQDKLRNEIQNLYATYGELTYDNINSMAYLNKVFKETVRKYPIADVILRRSSSSYTFRDTNLTIPKGLSLGIPVYAIHNDPKIYPNPEVYDPERFSDEAIRLRDPMHYIPFGYGARNCIGERLGILQTKVGLVAFFRNYKIDICDKTIKSYKFHLLPVAVAPAEPLYFKVTKINSV